MTAQSEHFLSKVFTFLEACFLADPDPERSLESRVGIGFPDT